MIYFNGLSGEDFDFLGTYKVFENIKYNFTASINSEMNPLTDEEGTHMMVISLNFWTQY